MKESSDLRVGLASLAGIPQQTTGTRRSPIRREPERYYVGRRPRQTEVYVIRGTEIEPLEHRGYRSRAPFDWGAPSDGGLELAYAILLDSTEIPPPDAICLIFWTDVVACLGRPGFVLEHSEIALWLLTAFRDPAELPPSSGPRWLDRIRRRWAWRKS